MQNKDTLITLFVQSFIQQRFAFKEILIIFFCIDERAMMTVDGP
jgi:hypothetical protein